VASLATLRSLFYVYVGTKTTDPLYPSSTVDALINAAANRYKADLQQMNPGWLSDTATLTLSSGAVSLPADFAGVLDLRIDDSTGSRLREVRYEELGLAWSGAVYAITGSDATATLHCSSGVDEDATLYLVYRTQPAELSAGTDVPSWMPGQFHDLLAREAAVDGFGLGSEGAPTPVFLERLDDARAQFWHHVRTRSTQPLLSRESI
jgi:hypothetical protein